MDDAEYLPDDFIIKKKIGLPFKDSSYFSDITRGKLSLFLNYSYLFYVDFEFCIMKMVRAMKQAVCCNSKVN